MPMYGLVMASVYPRKNKDGTTSWRVVFRRKNLKTFCLSFAEEQEAKDFVSLNEKEFVLNPQNFSVDRLDFKREQEFKRR